MIRLMVKNVLSVFGLLILVGLEFSGVLDVFLKLIFVSLNVLLNILLFNLLNIELYVLMS